MNLLYYGVRILAHYFVLSQSRRLTDGWTDRNATAIPCVCIRSSTLKMLTSDFHLKTPKNFKGLQDHVTLLTGYLFPIARLPR